MSKADKLFEKLGYEKYKYSSSVTKSVEYIEYSKENREIVFYRENKSVCASCGVEAIDINMKELKAIYMKCKELGWKE